MASVQIQPVTPSPVPALLTPSRVVPVVSSEREEQVIYTIDGLLRARAAGDKADEPIVAYPAEGTEYAYYTPRQLHTFVEAAAVHYSKVIPQRRSSQDAVQVVGLLGPSDFEYLITLLAISRLGHTVLLLSTRIAEDAYVSLVESTKTTFLVTHASFQKMGENVAQRTGVIRQSVLSREDYELPVAVDLPAAQLDAQTEAKHVCWVIHSSGSTGHPKPIYQTHSGALRNYANNFGLRGYITLPLFHAHGISCLFRAVHSQKLIYMYNANLPLTAPSLLATLHDHPEIEVLYAVPYALKLLSETEEGLKKMARLDLVMFGGSSCPKPIGDKLVQNGVRLVSHYGTTETGQLMTSFRDRSDLDWDYVRPGPTLLPYLRWEEQMPGIYELSVLEGWPSKVASNRPNGSYATKDLFEKHPTKENAWRYYARLDDTLVLENGEKANPLVIEGVARNNPNVAEAIAFGANKPRLGLFLVHAENSSKTDGELVDSAFPAIEQCNAESPAYAYISRDMIRVLPADAEYRKTDKGTVIRSAFYRDYQEQIDLIYDSEDAQGDKVLEGDELLDFLREQLLQIAPSIEPSSLNNTTDIFGLGVDSLQSIRLRSVILKTLDLKGQKISQNFVFENPSVQAMADELTRLFLGDSKEEVPVEDRMQNLIRKYTEQIPAHISLSRDYDGEHVVVTGATGSLGAHVVAQLARSDNVRRIYCLVRAKTKHAAYRRVRQSLRDRAVLEDLTSDVQRKIVALPSDLSDGKLGLDFDTYHELMECATAVIHCAWSVNFSWSLESFEQSCIAGTRNLLGFCLNVRAPQPARFSFCSSVSTVARTPGGWAPEALPESLSYAQNMGYAQSKLVTEHIVNRVAQQTGMSARVLRVGQIIGDTVHGIWNDSEAIPMILQTAKTIGALPQLDDVLSWTPVDTIASSVIDLTLAEDAGEVMNVTNPILKHWTYDLLPLLKQAGLDFEVVDRQEWLRRLLNSNRDPAANPPIKLLPFFANKYGHNHSKSFLFYSTNLAQAAAPALRQAGGLTQELVTRFARYFQNECWNQTASSPPISAQRTSEVIFLIGPCGCGKTTAAHAITERLGLPVIEGDDMHSPAARKKMSNKIPLTDEDRWEWLAHIRGAVMDRLQQHRDIPGLVVTCSALRTVYRDRLRRLSELFDFPVGVTFLLLDIHDKEKLEDRLVARSEGEGHYMAASMVDSQLELLEEPDMSEGDIIRVNSSQGKWDMLRDVEARANSIL
ncbi:acetyl-CoA synthetase-like protein [Aspergillus steynii IBT 23096]|uniref:gluconokinase n=1 Tax=Aspergillus steynii IBT 23096 TaxID=1392250 RepID=A0A2I2GHI9_9EURO|nr:acetyl-CoA synthetase-like protein [Aspergillus steynii IBT 23096]PLB52351.1 acetyl-CoA synthetase-like protein [Aspergillus steynii IBT 23096]